MFLKSSEAFKLNFRGIVLAAITLGMLAMAGIQAQAAEAVTPCDPEVMQAMKARAWLEAQREITQNQNLIYKPDSVLEYSCFRGFLDKAASNYSIAGVNRQFSESTQWGTGNGFGPETTDQALSWFVGTALASYLTANFEHSFLGGRLEDITVREADYFENPAEVKGEQNYNCDVMARVWEAARCLNFNERDGGNFDGFYDFKHYAETEDPRNLGEPVVNACQSGSLAGLYNSMMREAFNDKQDAFVQPAGDDLPQANNTRYVVEDVMTYFDLILPRDCGAPIPTGVKIRRNGADTDDFVCSNPGCTYNGSSCTR